VSPSAFDGDHNGYQFQGVVAGAFGPTGAPASEPGFKVIATPNSVATGTRAFAAARQRGAKHLKMGGN
jgi:hypothetical protein